MATMAQDGAQPTLDHTVWPIILGQGLMHHNTERNASRVSGSGNYATGSLLSGTDFIWDTFYRDEGYFLF